MTQSQIYKKMSYSLLINSKYVNQIYGSNDKFGIAVKPATPMNTKVIAQSRIKKTNKQEGLKNIISTITFQDQNNIES